MITNPKPLTTNDIFQIIEENGAISLYERPKTHAGAKAAPMIGAIRGEIEYANPSPLNIIVDESLGEPDIDANGMTIMGHSFVDTNGELFLSVAAKAWVDDRFRLGTMPKSWVALRSATFDHVKTSMICFGEDRHKARLLLADAFELAVLSTELEVIDDETVPKHLPSAIIVVVQDGADEQALEAIAEILDHDADHEVILLTEKTIARFKIEMAAINQYNADLIAASVEAAKGVKH